jgi:hypothetical protein
MLQSLMWRSYYRNSIVRRGISTILKGEEVGHEFRGNQWTEGQGGGRQEKPSEEKPKAERTIKTNWNSLLSSREVNQALKENYKIGRCTAIGPSKSERIEWGRKLGNLLDQTCQKYPGLQDLLVRHKGISVVEMDSVSRTLANDGNSTTNGLYTSPSGYGGGARIQVLIGGEFSDWTPGPIAPRGSWHPVQDNRSGDTWNHELGHHIHRTCLTTKWRERWSDVVEKAASDAGLSGGEKKYLEANISTYAGTNAREYEGGGDKFLGSRSYSHDQKYGEGFAESFCKFVSPYYKGDLPKPIHDFMTKIMEPKKKKG